MSKKNYDKNKNRNKGKGGSKPENNKPDYKDDKNASCSYENDALWYAMSEQLLSQIDSWSFDDVIGLPTRAYGHPTDGDPVRKGVAHGDIMRISLLPTIGGENGLTSAYNNKSPVAAACQRTYSILSASNGKTTKYLPEDIGLVILMLGNIISNVSVYWRLVGIRRLFSPRNRQVPNRLIEAMGFNCNDFLKKIANSMERFDNIIARLDGISMFADIDYFKKCDELYAHIFFDKGSAMGQYYITKPAGWFRYVDGALNPETGWFEGNKLYYNEWAGLMEIDNFLDVLEDQVNDMLTSELFNLVYSDVIREIRRNGGSIYQFNIIDRNYSVLPEFSEVFMTQVHNMTWGWITDLSEYEIRDDVDNLDLVSTLDYTIDPTSVKRFFMGDQLVDFPYTDNPDYKLVAEALAFKAMGDYYVTEGSLVGEVEVRAIPDHMVYKVDLYTTTGNGTEEWFELPFICTATDFNNAIVHGILAFNVTPMLTRIYSAENPGGPTFLGELNYWTTISATKMERVYTQSFLKLFSPKFTESLPGTTISK